MTDPLLGMDPLDLLSDDEGDVDEADGKATAGPAAKKPKLGLDSLGLDFAALQRAGYKPAEEVNDESEKQKAAAAMSSAFNALSKQVQRRHPSFREQAAAHQTIVASPEVLKQAQERGAELEKEGRAKLQHTKYVPLGPQDGPPIGVLVVEQSCVQGLLEHLDTINQVCQVMSRIDQTTKGTGYSVVSIYGPPNAADRAKGFMMRHMEEMKGNRCQETVGNADPPDDVEVFGMDIQNDRKLAVACQIVEPKLGEKISGISSRQIFSEVVATRHDEPSQDDVNDL